MANFIFIRINKLLNLKVHVFFTGKSICTSRLLDFSIGLVDFSIFNKYRGENISHLTYKKNIRNL